MMDREDQGSAHQAGAIGRKASTGPAGQRLTMAARADRHELYEAAVQSAEAEVAFMRKTFRAVRGRYPRTLREDFSGPGSVACEWVRHGARSRATAVDIDAEVLAWGMRHRVSRLSAAQQRRIEVLNSDVLRVATAPADVVAALNFSYWVFKRRDVLRRYFRAVRRGLVADGLLFLDAFGGYEAFSELRESTRHSGFTYIWEQAQYLPVTGDLRCHIHFRFPDGSELQEAFSYEWRLWTLPEIREVLAEAGFRRSTVYWEGDDGRGGGNGVFTPEERGEPEAGWIAYVVAEP